MNATKIKALLDFHTLGRMRLQPPKQFEWLNFDSNNDCNVHCVYCHNPRSKAMVDTNDFSAFLDQNVISVDHFRVGCGMEPTLDPRLADLMLLISASKAKPTGMFLLQTNGILLHRHDLLKMRDAGLTCLSVSIDAADPETHKALRGGTSMAKVHSNILAFRKTLPQVNVAFVTTVTTLNVHAMKELVTFGLDLGVSEFNLREMFYRPESNVVDHTKMPALVLGEGEFENMKNDLLAAFGGNVPLRFYDAAELALIAAKMKVESPR